MASADRAGGNLPTLLSQAGDQPEAFEFARDDVSEPKLGDTLKSREQRA